jgi:hypothetical protein
VAYTNAHRRTVQAPTQKEQAGIELENLVAHSLQNGEIVVMTARDMKAATEREKTNSCAA